MHTLIKQQSHVPYPIVIPNIKDRNELKCIKALLASISGMLHLWSTHVVAKTK